jgi:hypothetical protein
MTYEDLVAAATVGLSHRPLPISGLSGAAGEHAALLDAEDQAAALLDAAALLVTARRAGQLPVTGPRPLPAAPADAAPELPARAADLLELAQAHGPALLGDLLGLAAGHGYRAPVPLLPALLDAGLRDSGLARAVAGVLGARGRWLAGHRADWRRVAEEAPGADPAADGDPGMWETGGRAERRGCLAALRERDPAAARELLAAGWSRETGDDRADLLAVLARGLSPADEEFLEAALDDRKESVRVAARGLLAALPGSAFTRRTAERAAAQLRLDRRGKRQVLTAELPGRGDAAAVRDGLANTASAVGTGAWRLTRIIAAAPLAGWVTRFGLAPAQIVSLPVDGGLRTEVHAGWRLAAIREASAPWAEALLAVREPGPASERPRGTWPRDHELAAVLPPDARVERAAALLAAGPPADAVAEVAACPRPWPGPLSDAVVTALRRAVAEAAAADAATARPRPAIFPASALVQLASKAGRPAPPAAASRPGWPGALATLAGRGLPATGPADHAAVLAQLAATGNCPPNWSSALRRGADAIALRRAFLKEIR